MQVGGKCTLFSGEMWLSSVTRSPQSQGTSPVGQCVGQWGSTPVKSQPSPLQPDAVGSAATIGGGVVNWERLAAVFLALFL